MIISLIVFSGGVSCSKNDTTLSSEDESGNDETVGLETELFEDRFFKVIEKLKKGDLDSGLYRALGVEAEDPEFANEIIGGGAAGPGGTDSDLEVLVEGKYILYIGGSTYNIPLDENGVQLQMLWDVRLYNNLKKVEGEIVSYDPIYPYWINGELKSDE